MADAIVRFDAPEPLESTAEAASETGGEPDAGSARPQLGSLLVRDGFIGDGQLDDALREGRARGERLGEVVVRNGWASEEDVAKLLAEQWGLDYVERSSIWFDANALAKMSREEAQQLEALPTRVQDGRVVVAVAEPTEERLAALRQVIGEETVVVVVPKSALDAGLKSELLGGRRDSSGEGRDAGDGSADELAEEEIVLAEPEYRSQPSAPAPPPVPAATPERDPEPMPRVASFPPIRAVTAAADAAPAPAPPQPTEQPLAPAAHGEADLAPVLARLQEAANQAAAFQHQAGSLAQSLELLVGDLASVADRLAQASSDQERARIGMLEEQLAQRTELTERLRTQLTDLTRTLERLE